MTEISSRRLTDVMRINFRLLRMQHLPHSVLFPWGTYSNIPTGIPRLGKNQKARFIWPISARLSNVNNLTVKWVIALSGSVSWSRETDDEAPCISECSHDVPQRYAETNTTEFLILVVPYQTLAVSQGDLTNRTKIVIFEKYLAWHRWLLAAAVVYHCRQTTKRHASVNWILFMRARLCWFAEEKKHIIIWI